jgi:ActR/RegA family two-component response regulator
MREAQEELGGANAWQALILDVLLPDGSGLHLLSAVREKDATVPALVLTALLDHDVANAAVKLGAQYLVKPVEMTAVEAFVQQAQARQTDALLTVRQPVSLHRATWVYIHEVVAHSASRSAAAKTLGIAPRSLRRMLSKDPPLR